jgi:hypothetical protein
VYAAWWLTLTGLASTLDMDNGGVSSAESMQDSIRPSWENNLNWWIDGNDALEALQQTPPAAEPSATQLLQVGIGANGDPHS